MKLFFLDQSGHLGGAELSLLDVAHNYRHQSLVGLFQDGPFRQRLEERQIPVRVLSSQTLSIRKKSGLGSVLKSLGQLMRLVFEVARASRSYDIIYANTPKALIIGALASLLNRRPLIYHLRDIISAEHFSSLNRFSLVTLANRCGALVIANSEATRQAFIEAGGRRELAQVVYNGFDPNRYYPAIEQREQLRQNLLRELSASHNFVIGHFSRLSPWKGQHILIEALSHCPDNVIAVFVGDSLFGEQAYVDQIHRQVRDLGLEDRVKFLGFRSDIPQLMAACDLIAHTSTAPEPFGRVIVEGMLCGVPVVAAAAGGAVEIIDSGKTGWLSPPGDVQALADIICCCYDDPAMAQSIALAGYKTARERFSLETSLAQLDQLIKGVNRKTGSVGSVVQTV